MSTPNDGPRKQYTLVLHAEGHTWPDLIFHLEELRAELEAQIQAGNFQKGGRSILGGRGFIEVLFDPNQTPEKYDAELEEWFLKQRAEKAAGGGA